MNKEITMPRLDSVLVSKKNVEKKKIRSFSVDDKTWQSMANTADSLGLSRSKYLEVLHNLYLEANKKSKEQKV